MKRLCATVLALEAIVFALAVPVAVTIGGADPAAAGIAGGGLALVSFTLAGMLRHRWAYAAGSVLQLVAIAAGFAVTTMFFLGGIFAALWFTAIWLGRRVEGA